MANVAGRNDVRLVVDLDGGPVSHFRLKEFENRDGLAMVHASALFALECVRRDLCAMAAEPVWVIVRDGVSPRVGLGRGAAGVVRRTGRHVLVDVGARPGRAVRLRQLVQGRHQGLGDKAASVVTKPAAVVGEVVSHGDLTLLLRLQPPPLP